MEPFLPGLSSGQKSFFPKKIILNIAILNIANLPGSVGHHLKKECHLKNERQKGSVLLLEEAKQMYLLLILLLLGELTHEFHSLGAHDLHSGRL